MLVPAPSFVVLVSLAWRAPWGLGLSVVLLDFGFGCGDSLAALSTTVAMIKRTRPNALIARLVSAARIDTSSPHDADAFSGDTRHMDGNRNADFPLRKVVP